MLMECAQSNGTVHSGSRGKSKGQARKATPWPGSNLGNGRGWRGAPGVRGKLWRRPSAVAHESEAREARHCALPHTVHITNEEVPQ